MSYEEDLEALIDKLHSKFRKTPRTKAEEIVHELLAEGITIAEMNERLDK